MLRKIKDMKRVPAQSLRRWFSDTSFDLIVCYASGMEIKGFQLCYRRGVDERELTCHQQVGFSYNRIEGDEKPGRYKMAPVLVPDGLFGKNQILALFTEQSAEIDPAKASFVCEKIMEYPAGPRPGGD